MILTILQRTLSVLNDLVEDPRNMVYIMSARRPQELDRLFRLVPNLGLIAENGCFVKNVGSNLWAELADRASVAAWKESVKAILNYYLERTPGAEIEERHCSLIFHYKDAEDFAMAERQASDWTGHINESCEDQRVHATQLENAVVVESIDWTKHTAATEVYKEHVENAPYADKAGPIDFMLVIGDGREDEKVFTWANGLGQEKAVNKVVTVGLSSRNTEATATLTQGVSGKHQSQLYLPCRTNISLQVYSLPFKSWPVTCRIGQRQQLEDHLNRQLMFWLFWNRWERSGAWSTNGRQVSTGHHEFGQLQHQSSMDRRAQDNLPFRFSLDRLRTHCIALTYTFSVWKRRS